MALWDFLTKKKEERPVGTVTRQIRSRENEVIFERVIGNNQAKHIFPRVESFNLGNLIIKKDQIKPALEEIQQTLKAAVDSPSPNHALKRGQTLSFSETPTEFVYKCTYTDMQNRQQSFNIMLDKTADSADRVLVIGGSSPEAFRIAAYRAHDMLDENEGHRNKVDFNHIGQAKFAGEDFWLHPLKLQMDNPGLDTLFKKVQKEYKDQPKNKKDQAAYDAARIQVFEEQYMTSAFNAGRPKGEKSVQVKDGVSAISSQEPVKARVEEVPAVASPFSQGFVEKGQTMPKEVPKELDMRGAFTTVTPLQAEMREAMKGAFDPVVSSQQKTAAMQQVMEKASPPVVSSHPISAQEEKPTKGKVAERVRQIEDADAARAAALKAHIKTPRTH